MEKKNEASVGYTSQIIGPVLDITFPSGKLPKIYNAINVKTSNSIIVCEVQQLLGDNRIRKIENIENLVNLRELHLAKNKI